MVKRTELVDVALGSKPGDLAVINANIINVYTGETLTDQAVVVKGEWIAYVGPDQKHGISDATQVIDAEGATLIPGLIDGHGHLVWLSTADEFLRYAATGGTTTIITETLEAYPVAGLPGVLDFLASLKDQPIKFFGTAPAMVSTSQTAMGIALEDLETLLKRDDIVGMGESYWQAVMQNRSVFEPGFEKTLASGKRLEGHTAGARGGRLQAYVAQGISSCHEPITAEEALERLRLGVYVMIREGSIRRDLTEISKIKDKGIDTRRLILTPDGITPADLMEMGYMEYLVQKAIDCGFDPITAVQMATLNVAEHFNLDDRIGGIAPGKYADFLLIPNPNTIKALCVVSNGRVIANNGKLDANPRKHTFSYQNLNSINLPSRIEPDNFCIRYSGQEKTATVRVIEMVTDLVTREAALDLPVKDGEIKMAEVKDVAKIAAIDRHHHPGKCFTGLIKGFGLDAGAMACSAAWDTACIVVVGRDEADMALSINEIRKLQGGAVVCNEGQVLTAMALPVFGLLSQLPMETIAQQVRAFNEAALSMGVAFPNPMLSLITQTGAAIPFLRICEEGLVNFKDGKALDLFLT